MLIIKTRLLCVLFAVFMFSNVATVFATGSDEGAADANGMQNEFSGSAVGTHLLGGSSPNLMGNWTFKEGKGNYANDTSGNNKNGTLKNFDLTKCWVRGVDGTGLAFDGKDDRVDIPIDSPEYNYTFAFWFKTEEQNTGISSARYPSMGGDFDREIYLSGGKLSNRLYDEQTITTTGTYSDNYWHYAAIVVEKGVGQKIFVDGKLGASGNKDSSDFTWDSYINLGYGKDSYFKGTLDEVRLYNGAMTSGQVSDGYNDTVRTHVFINVSNTLVCVFNKTYNQDLICFGGNGVYTWSLKSGSLPSGISLASNGKISGISTVLGAYPVTFKLSDSTGCNTTADVLFRVQKNISLQLELPLDEGRGAWANDASGLGRNGSLTNMNLSTCWTQGANGTGITLDGVNDYTIVPAAIPTVGNFSVNLWARAELSNTGCREILSQGSGGNAFYLGMDTWNIRAGEGWPNTGIAFPSDTLWHMFTVTKSSTNTWLYLDNKQVASKGSAIMNPISTSIYIGKQYTTFAEHFNGTVDDVRVFNKTLSRSEISGIYNETVKKNVFINTSSLPPSRINTPYQIKLASYSGTPTLTWSMKSGSLPAGVSWATDGNISGTPTVMGKYPITVKLVDSKGANRTMPLTLYVQKNWSMQLELTMDEGKGVWANDASGMGRNGSLSNMNLSSCWTKGANGTGLAFDGTNDHVIVQDGPGFDDLDDLSVSVWVYPTSNMPPYCIVSKRNAFIIGPSGNDNKVDFSIYDGNWRGTGSSANALPMNAWTHIVGVYGNAANILKLYFNGKEVRSNAANYGKIQSDTGPLYIGWDDGKSGRYFPGVIDEVRVYNKTLSGSEVLGVFNETTKNNVFFNTTSLPLGRINTPYNTRLTGFGGTGFYTWSLMSGSLPSGVSLATDGNISGTPTVIGKYPITVKLVDSKGANRTRPFVLNVLKNMSLQLELEMDEGQGAWAKDDSGFARNGSLKNMNLSKCWVQGAMGYGLDLDDVDDYVELSSDLSSNIQNAITISAWVCARSSNGEAQTIVSERYAGDGNVEFCLILQYGHLKAGFFDGSWWLAQDPSLFPLNQWVHTVATYDGATLRTYVDSKQVASTTVNRALPSGTNGWYVGHRWDFADAGNLWDGYLDKVLIYNATLSASQVSALYNTTFNNTVFFDPTLIPTGRINTPYLQPLVPKGGAGGYNFNTTSGALPSGISLYLNGTIKGTPTKIGASTFTVKLNDTAGRTRNQTYSLFVQKNWSLQLELGMDEGKGAWANDTSGLERNGLLANMNMSSCWTDGVVDGGLSFDGTNDHVRVQDAPGFDDQNNLTVSVWIFPTANMPPGCIVSKRDAFIINPGNYDNTIAFYIYDGNWRTITCSTPLELNQWTNIVGVYGNTANIFKLYINGKLAASDATNYGKIQRDTGPLYIGWDDGQAGKYFQGRMDEARIYNVTLSASEISQRYNDTWVDYLSHHVYLNKTSVPFGIKTKPYFTSLKAVGATGKYTWTVDSGAMPAGLGLTTGGNITGTPTEKGVFAFVAKVTDANGTYAIRPFTIYIWENLTGLVGDWTFDHKDYGLGLDLSGCFNNGTLQNIDTDTNVIPGKLKDALRFDGIDDSIRVPHSGSLDGPRNLTVEAWARSGYIPPTTTMPSDPIAIYNITQLQSIGNNASYPLNGNYYLANDIDAGITSTWNSGSGFLPIGSSSAFTGYFDGRGHSIKRLFIFKPSSSNIGLFGQTDGAMIKDLGVDEGDVTGYAECGLLIGYAEYSKVIGCHSTGVLNNNTSTFNNDFGGLIGYLDHSKLYSCHSSVPVKGPITTASSIGGLVGQAYISQFEECYATGKVTAVATSTNYVGGLIGKATLTTAVNCYATGAVSSKGTYTGGLAGHITSSSTLRNCYANGSVDGVSYVGGLVGHCLASSMVSYCIGPTNASITGTSRVGGLVGQLADSSVKNSYVTDCYVNFSKTASSGQYFGGLVGYSSSSTVSNSFAYDRVNGYDLVGGLIGYRSDSNVINSYAYGAVHGVSNLGGLIGTYSGSGSVTSSYFDDHVTSSSPGGGTAKSAAELQAEPTYAGWDFESYWSMGGPNSCAGLQAPWQTLVSKGAYSMLLNRETSVLKAGVGKEYLNVTVSTVGNWHQYAMTYNGSYITAYQDGVCKATLKVGLQKGNNTNDVYLGGTDQYLQGALDEVKIFNGSRTASQIKDGYDLIFRPPVITTEDVKTATEEVLYSVDYAYTDLNNDIAIWGLKTDAPFLAMNTTNGLLNGTPTNDQAAKSYWVNISCNDGMFQAHRNFTLTVANTNDAPEILTNNTLTTLEDALYSVDYDAYDMDPVGDVLTWSLATNATWLSMNGTTGVLSGTPSSADLGLFWVNVTVSDGTVNVTASFVLEVINANDAPVITTLDIAVATEHAAYSNDYNATDPDPTLDTLTWSMKTNASWLSIANATGILSGTPGNDDVGSYWVNVTVSDGKGGADWSNFTLAVVNVNDPPVIVTDDLTLATENVPYSVDYTAVDIDPTADVMTWSLRTNAGWLAMASTTGTLFGTPDDPDVGPFWVNVSVTDGHGGLDFSNFTLTVANANDAPKITTLDVTTAKEDLLYRVEYRSYDIDPTADTLTWSLATNAKWITISSSTGVLFGIPDNEDVGSYWVNVSVNDSKGGLAWHYFTLTVVNVNDPPVISAPAVGNAIEGVPFSLDLNATDIDKPVNELTWTVVTNASWLKMNAATGTLSGTPAKGDAGTVMVNVSVDDGNEGRDWYSFTLLVLKDTDGDKIPDSTDADDDGDGVPDTTDAFPLDSSESVDSDKDGVGNNADQDDDNDGMPDTWEQAHGLNATDATDASKDNDGDGKTNLEEFTAGTDPNVSDKKVEEEESDQWTYLIIGALVVLALIIGIVVFMRMRNRPEADKEDATEEDKGEGSKEEEGAGGEEEEAEGTPAEEETPEIVGPEEKGETIEMPKEAPIKKIHIDDWPLEEAKPMDEELETPPMSEDDEFTEIPATPEEDEEFVEEPEPPKPKKRKGKKK